MTVGKEKARVIPDTLGQRAVLQEQEEQYRFGASLQQLRALAGFVANRAGEVHRALRDSKIEITYEPKLLKGDVPVVYVAQETGADGKTIKAHLVKLATMQSQGRLEGFDGIPVAALGNGAAFEVDGESIRTVGLVPGGYVQLFSGVAHDYDISVDGGDRMLLGETYKINSPEEDGPKEVRVDLLDREFKVPVEGPILERVEQLERYSELLKVINEDLQWQLGKTSIEGYPWDEEGKR